MSNRIHTLILTAAAALTASSAHADKLKVPDQFPTIQSAIDFARAGDRIKIGRGFFDEDLDLRDKTDIVIKGTANTFVRSISLDQADRCVVKELTFTGSGTQVNVDDSDDVRLRNLTMKGSFRGMDIDRSDRLIIETSDVIDVQRGIEIDDSEEPTVRMVLFEANSTFSLDIDDSPKARVEECVFKSTEKMDLEDSDQSTVRGNVFKDARLDVTRCDGALIDGNKLKNKLGDGMRISSSDGVTVDGNAAKRCGDVGIRVSLGSANRLTDNKIKRSGDVGLRMETGSHIMIGNKSVKNTRLDVEDFSGGQNTYIDNTFGLTFGV